MSRIFKAIILNDETGHHYADMVFKKIKTIETRMRRFSYYGDLVICCGKTNSVTSNAGKALCIVEMNHWRMMRKEDEQAACIEQIEGRVAYELRNWRFFSRQFEFKNYKVSGTWQGIFDLRIPDNIEIIEDANP